LADIVPEGRDERAGMAAAMITGAVAFSLVGELRLTRREALNNI